MFFSVAWLRLFIATAFLAPSFVQAHLNSLFTSSVSYCSPPESILIQQFDIAYVEHNTSVTFNVSAASVLPNLNVSANLFVNVYGMRPLNMTIDLCSLLNGVLCPLPTYNFTGADSITLPSSVNVAHLLPRVAYIIPDLEAYAQLTLTEVGTGKVRACIQATLSNGWSAHQKGVEWSTGAIALLAFVSAAVYSWYAPETLTAVRMLDVIYLFQTIAASGLLALNYSSVYRAYALNFSWALGFFSMSPSSSIQRSINNMRRLTGGDVTSSQDDSTALSLVNRKLSPYNAFAVSKSLYAQTAAQPIADISSFISGAYEVSSPEASSAASRVLGNADVLVGGDVATVTQGSGNVLQAGIPIYVNMVGIDTANSFMTLFFITLIFAAIVLAALGLGYLILYVWTRSSQEQDEARHAMSKYPAFARAWGLRGALVCVLPIFIFAFYQWTLKDSWLSTLLAVILLLILLTCVIPPVFFVLRSVLPLPARWSGDGSEPSPALAPLVAHLRPERYYFIIPAMVAIFVKALVIAFGQDHGLVQTIVLLVFEFLMLGFILLLRPNRTRGGDVLSTFLAIIRVVCTGLMIAFAESLALDAIPRVVIGIIIAVLYSIAVVIMFLNILWNLGAWRILHLCGPLRRKNGAPTGATSLTSDNPSRSSLGGSKARHTDSEKGLTITVTPASSSHFYQRPNNPSPTHTPTTLSEFSPIPTSVSHFSEAQTEHASTFMTSTLGDELPHRWSFHHSPPPSASGVSHSAGTPSALSPVSPTESVYITPRDSWRPPSRENHSRQPSS